MALRGTKSMAFWASWLDAFEGDMALGDTDEEDNDTSAPVAVFLVRVF